MYDVFFFHGSLLMQFCVSHCTLHHLSYPFIEKSRYGVINSYLIVLSIPYNYVLCVFKFEHYNVQNKNTRVHLLTFECSTLNT